MQQYFEGQLTQEESHPILLRAEMGSGKTYAAIEFVAKHPELRILYFAPTHKVCDEIGRELESRGVKFKHLKGREFVENGIPYCLKLDEVKEIQQNYFASAEMICSDCPHNCLRKEVQDDFCLYKAQFKKDDSNCIITVPQYLQTKTLSAKFEGFDYLIIDDGYDSQSFLDYSLEDIRKLGDFLLDLCNRGQFEEFDRFPRFTIDDEKKRYLNIARVIGEWALELGKVSNWFRAGEEINYSLSQATNKEELKKLIFDESNFSKVSSNDSIFSLQDQMVTCLWHLCRRNGFDLSQIASVLKKKVDDYLLPGEVFDGKDGKKMEKMERRQKKEIHKLLEQYFEFQWRHHYRQLRDGKEEIELPKLILSRLIELLFQVVHSWKKRETFTNIQFQLEIEGHPLFPKRSTQRAGSLIHDSFEKCHIPRHKKAIILDGTPDYEYYKRHFPNLELIDFPNKSANNAVITQFVNGKFGKKQLSNNQSRMRVFGMIKDVIKRDCKDLLEAGAKFLITGSLSFMKETENKNTRYPKSIRTFLFDDPDLREHRDQFSFVHFNSVRSSNEFKDYHVLIHFGEINPSWADTESYVRTFYPYEPELQKIPLRDARLRNHKLIEEDEVPVKAVKKDRKFKSLLLGPNFPGDWKALENLEIVHDVEYLDERVQGFIDKIRNSELAQLIYRVRPSQRAKLNGEEIKKRIFIFNSREIPGIEPHIVMRRETNKREQKEKIELVLRTLNDFAGATATIAMLSRATALRVDEVRKVLRRLEGTAIKKVRPDEAVLDEHRKAADWKGRRGRIPEAFALSKKIFDLEQKFDDIESAVDKRLNQLELSDEPEVIEHPMPPKVPTEDSLDRWIETCPNPDTPDYSFAADLKGELPKRSKREIDREQAARNLRTYLRAVTAIKTITRNWVWTGDEGDLIDELEPLVDREEKRLVRLAAKIDAPPSAQLVLHEDALREDILTALIENRLLFQSSTYNFWRHFPGNAPTFKRDLSERIADIYFSDVDDEIEILLSLIVEDVRLTDLLFGNYRYGLDLAERISDEFPEIISQTDLQEIKGEQRDEREVEQEIRQPSNVTPISMILGLDSFKYYLAKVVSQHLAPAHLESTLEKMLHAQGSVELFNSFAEALYFLAGVNLVVLDQLEIDWDEIT